MGLLKLLVLLMYTYAAVILVHVLNLVESMVIVQFGQTPPPRSRYSYAVFKYSFETLDGSNACQNNTCSIYCQVLFFLSLFFGFLYKALPLILSL